MLLRYLASGAREGTVSLLSQKLNNSKTYFPVKDLMNDHHGHEGNNYFHYPLNLLIVQCQQTEKCPIQPWGITQGELGWFPTQCFSVLLHE